MVNFIFLLIRAVEFTSCLFSFCHIMVMISVLRTKLLLIFILVVNATFGGLNRNVGARIQLFANCG